MPFQVSESLPLGRFVYEQSWTALRGAYVYPLRYFGDERSTDPNDYLEVVRVLVVDGIDVAVTRGGGLFVRTGTTLGTVSQIGRIAEVLNLVLCEMAVHGLYSHNVADTDVMDARLIGQHASIVGGWGLHGERTWGPFALLAASTRDLSYDDLPANPYWPPNFYWLEHDPAILDQIEPMTNSRKLSSFGDALPQLLVGACYHASRHNVAETILSAWMLCESLLSNIWDDQIQTATERGQKNRLKDYRIYTASVQLEVLLTAGRIDSETYRVVHEARRVRNDLAHSVKMSAEGAHASLNAMRNLLTVQGIKSDRLPEFHFSPGRGPLPRPKVEPVFEFTAYPDIIRIGRAVDASAG